MVQPARWTKTLLDVLADQGWYEMQSCSVRTFTRDAGIFRLKVETLGKYPGYGWRIWLHRHSPGVRSFFLPDEDAVIRYVQS